MKKILIPLLLASLLLIAACAADAPGDVATPAAPAAPADPTTPADDTEDAPPPADTTEDPITLTFWINDGSPQWMEVWDTVRDNFADVAPHITIENHGVPWADAPNVFNVAAATGTLPDMAHVANLIHTNMINLGVVRNVDDLFATYEGADNLLVSHFEFVRGMNQVEDGLWGFPMFGTSHQFWYRTDMFESAGITEFPTTWDEWFDAVEATTRDGHFGFSFRGGPGGWNVMLAFMMAYTDTVDFFDANGVSFLRRPEALEALTRYIGIFLNNQAPPTAVGNGYTEMIAEVTSHNAAIVYHHLQSAELLREHLAEDLIGYGWIPLNSNGRRIKFDDPQCIAIFNTAAEENMQAIFEYIRFLWTPEQQFEIVSRAGGVPTNINTTVDDPFIMMALVQDSDPATVSTRFPSYIPGFGPFTNEVLSPNLQAMMLGELDPAVAIAQWADDLEAMLAEFLAG
ncbi:MAG: extracellular solute-binding protein [Oscillospiraceae bacterium]|nr:extracellular solute-binding protein [Oscillospiraceae bacterium]